MKNLSEKQKIIQEEAKLIKEKEKDSTNFLAAAENLHETLSTRTMNKLSEKEKIIQQQAKQIEEKENEGKKILAATENLKESERSQAEMAKNLEETEAESSIAMMKLIEKRKIIQEQAKLIK